MKKVWLITGASRGLGFAWAKSALARGDLVIGAARNINNLDVLKQEYSSNFISVQMDVTSEASIKKAVKEGIKLFKKIDVLINNAGYGLFSPVETATEQDSHNVFETNFFGSLRVIQEVLPIMKQQKHGHIIQISSIAGLVNFPGIGLYNASKSAIESLIESLNLEIQNTGIKTSIVEPGPHATDWIDKSSVSPEYDTSYPTKKEFIEKFWPRLPLSKNENAVQPMLDLVDSKTPPFRLVIGDGLKKLIKDSLKLQIENINFYHES